MQQIKLSKLKKIKAVLKDKYNCYSIYYVTCIKNKKKANYNRQKEKKMKSFVRWCIKLGN